MIRLFFALFACTSAFVFLAVFGVGEARAQSCVSKVDVIFAVDTSGSMEEEAQVLCREVLKTVEALNAEQNYDVAYGVYEIGPNGRTHFPSCARHIPHANPETKEGIASIGANPRLFIGHNDSTEDWTAAMLAIAEKGESAGLWRPEAQRVLVTMHDDWTGVGYHKTRQAGKDLAAQRILAFPYSTLGDLGERDQYQNFVGDFDRESPNGSFVRQTQAEIQQIDSDQGAGDETAQNWIARKTGGQETFTPLPVTMAGTIGRQLLSILASGFDADRDGLLSSRVIPLCGSCPVGASCTDAYDDPGDFGLPRNAENFSLFSRTAKDLDGDGHDVANGRLPSVFPDPGGDDWYDNPFTSDFGRFKPTLEQLSHTINDLDLDGFIAESWSARFGGGDSVEPDDADVFISSGHGGNLAGCVFPGALEGTCFDCTAMVPDLATGRVPPGKTSASETNLKQVCQLEAYYGGRGIKTVHPGPGADIKAASVPASFEGKSLLAISAHCQDRLDNDLDGHVDANDLQCPKTGGLVPCGRESDDPFTANDETRSCGICHGFMLAHNGITFLIAPSSFNNGFAVVPLFGSLFVAAGGFLFLVGGFGAPQARIRGRQILFAAFIGFAIVYGSWVFVNFALQVFGSAEWLGAGSWWQIVCAG